MQFANPIWLLGLSGVVIPLAIHLLSRKEGKLIRIGSVRHLEETSTRQFKSIKLNEILLLALRTLIIILIVFFLSGLHWNNTGFQKTNWLLIEKGFEHDKDLSALIDSLKEKAYEVRALTEDFPIINDSIAHSPSDYWGLVELLKEKSLNEVVIISSTRVAALRGERIDLPRNFTWITKTPAPKEVTLTSLRSGPDSVWLRKGKFNSEQTEFETVKLRYIPGMTVTDPDTIQIAVVYDKKYEYDSRIIQASLRAINESFPQVMNIRVYSPEEFTNNSINDWTIWLSDKEISTVTGNKIVVLPIASGNLIQQKTFDTWILTQRLYTDNAIDNKLTVSLAGIIFPEKETWKQANANDIRSADEKIFSSGDQAPEHTARASSDGNMIWVLLIALTLLAERILSFVRKQ